MVGTPESPPDIRRRSPSLRRLSLAAELAVVAAWVLFVLRYQYQAEWEQAFDLRLDVFFLAAVAVVLLIRRAERSGGRAAMLSVLRVGMAATAACAALVAGEYALRFIYRDVNTAGSTGGYIMAHRQGPKVAFNSLGYREREIPAKAPGRYRIAIVGDSFTFGNGLELKDRLSNQLQAALGDRYEVFNFGVPGNNMPEHRQVLANVLRTSPDYVLLQLFVNDFETPRMRRPLHHPLLPGTVDAKLENASLLYTLLVSRWNAVQERIGAAESYPDYLARYLADPGSRDSVASASDLRAFFRDARAAGVGVGAFMFPALDAIPAPGHVYPFAFLHERMRNVCADEGVRCFDLLKDFSQFPAPRKLCVSPFDAHPSAVANRHAVGAIVVAFEGDWKVD